MPADWRNGFSRCASSGEICSTSSPIRRTPSDIAGDDLGILRPTCDFQAPRVHPIQGLSGILREASDPLTGELDQTDHQIAFTYAAYHASGARGGLRADLMLIQQRNVLVTSLRKVKRSRST